MTKFTMLLAVIIGHPVVLAYGYWLGFGLLLLFKKVVQHTGIMHLSEFRVKFVNQWPVLSGLHLINPVITIVTTAQCPVELVHESRGGILD